jgi:hypothetical protein
MREFNPETLTPWVTPVYAKSCLKEKGCTNAGTAEEPVDNFGQMTIFAQPVEDDCCGYGHQHADDEVVQHAQSAKNVNLTLGRKCTCSGNGSAACCCYGRDDPGLGGMVPDRRIGCGPGIPYVVAMMSALYVPSAGEGVTGFMAGTNSGTRKSCGRKPSPGQKQQPG